MRKPFLIVLVLLPAGVLVAFLLADRIPGYGIKSRWKKAVLHTMLSDEVPKIDVSGAIARKDSVLFLDTRSKKEYDVSHIRSAVFAGYKEFDFSVLSGIPKSQPIITYCSIGKRSDDIAKKLLHAGYTNVQNLYGGLFEWMNNGHLVVDNQNRPTEKIHAFDKSWGIWLNRGKKVY